METTITAATVIVFVSIVLTVLLLRARRRKMAWIDEAERLLIKSQGAPDNPEEARNIREWAESMYRDYVEDEDEGCEHTPESALWEEIQAGS